MTKTTFKGIEKSPVLAAKKEQVATSNPSPDTKLRFQAELPKLIRHTSATLDDLANNKAALRHGNKGEVVRQVKSLYLNPFLRSIGRNDLILDEKNDVYDHATVEVVKLYEKSLKINSNGTVESVSPDNGQFGLHADGVFGTRCKYAGTYKYSNDPGVVQELQTKFSYYSSLWGGVWDIGQVKDAPWLRWTVGDGQFYSQRHNGSLPEPIELSGTFMERVDQIARRWKIPPQWILTVLSFETGGTFSPKARNPRSSGSGIFQLMRDSARMLGISIEEFREMSAEEQLVYFDRYLDKVVGGQKIQSLSDLYMAVFKPEAIGKRDDHVLYSGSSQEYSLNAGVLDPNNDGMITKGGATRALLPHVPRAERLVANWGDQTHAKQLSTGKSNISGLVATKKE